MQLRSGQLETGSAGVQVAATLDLQSLRSRCEAGEEFKFLLFWGHTVPTGGQVGKTCLSQWYPSPFTVDGVLYRTAEHFMMAEKARIFGDDEKLAEILAAAKAPQVSTPWRHENPLKQSGVQKSGVRICITFTSNTYQPNNDVCTFNYNLVSTQVISTSKK